ncbi:MAG: hypothetical protein EOP86_15600 [Verrucomicrobiaceae bacterium]|nr:MAG: hypothetical protein EOP86_15600 [Verrucomicrobiaceae bacterium]
MKTNDLNPGPAISFATRHSRRKFLADVGRGTLLATVGPALAGELELASPALGRDGPEKLEFGEMEPLVAFMQETALTDLQPAMAAKLKAGTPLRTLLAAGALANARSFGGEDYIGFHTLMALCPAHKMADLMPSGQTALPVFKVLYRNTGRIQDHGGRKAEVLAPVAAEAGASVTEDAARQLHEAVKARDTAGAERMLAAMVSKDPAAAFNALLEVVQDDTEVHRTVLPYRAWDLLDVVGQAHASTLLRQSLRYCLNAEKYRRADWEEHGRVLTGLLDEHHLLGRAPGQRTAEDGYVENLSRTIFNGSPAEAAGAVAAALAEGFDPGAIGESLALAANQIVLRDPGRPAAWESPGKPVGSVHGDSIGVHASDSVNAWRNLSRVSQGRNVHACLILGAWQVARDRAGRPELVSASPLPTEYHVREYAGVSDSAQLLAKLDEAIRGNLQGHAPAVIQRIADLKLPEEPVFQCLLKYACSEDGSLHAEKYFSTARDDFRTTRAAFRWRHLAGLARVTASEYGRPAAGQAEARTLLG